MGSKKEKKKSVTKEQSAGASPASTSRTSKNLSKKEATPTPVKGERKAASGAGARRKGLAFESQLAQELGHIFPNAERQLEFQGSDNIGVDLRNSDVFLFQCKRWANYANPMVLIKEIRPQNEKQIPVLVTQANNRPAMAVLPFEKFVTLLEVAYGHRERFINPYMREALAITGARDIKSLPSTVVVPAMLPTLKDCMVNPNADTITKTLEWVVEHGPLSAGYKVPPDEAKLIKEETPFEYLQRLGNEEFYNDIKAMANTPAALSQFI